MSGNINTRDGSHVTEQLTIFKRNYNDLYLLTYLLTPWSRVLLEKLTGFSANQEIPRILWNNPKVHFRTHKRTPRTVSDIYHILIYRNVSIILGKIKPYIEKITGDYQNGFIDGRSVLDNIFALKIINEKTWEYTQSAHYLFIDFQEACDSIHGDRLRKSMEEFKIPNKLISTCTTCVQKTRSVVRIEGTLSSLFVNNTGLKQGDFLSPL